ncbi:hypothetical protein TWF730_001708 [Orbilia blumenaviensis]|uniref:F-box domain-containing protein n=1 Tax=Orbilia blumenaviensis TaxID=1796055 RepID=A0AAV9UIF9_9PEZI
MPSLPPEIWLSICSYLHSHDLKSVSRSTKYLYGTAMPYLFRAINISRETAIAIEGGGYSDLTDYVRSATIRGFSDALLDAAITDLEASCRALQYLPNVQHLKISFVAMREAQAYIYLATFREISQYTCYQKLTSLTLEFVPGTQSFSFNGNAIRSLSARIQKIMGDTSISCPPNIERLDVSGMANSYFDFTVRAMPYPCVLFYPTANTLKKIRIETNSLISPVADLDPIRNMNLATYSLVTEVWYIQNTHVNEFYSTYAEICRRFPNTQNLRFDYDGVALQRGSTAGETYQYLADLKKLRRAILPWPRHGYQSPIEPSSLGTSLGLWLRELNFQSLEYVDFVTRSCYLSVGKVCRIKPAVPQPIGMIQQRSLRLSGEIGL